MTHKMKIIISHDVDHLTVAEHFFKDLIIPKMLVRSFIHFISGKISGKTLLYRFGSVFQKKMNEIEQVMKYDLDNNIPSIFFFGMDNALGMSYSKKKIFPYVKMLKEQGVDVGIHGIDYQNLDKMKKEYEDFKLISGKDFFGIRNHYVRFDNDTFNKMSSIGYSFDSTQYNKSLIEYEEPYKIGKMWEFPLHIMDVYICKPGKLKEGVKNTKMAILEAEKRNMPYCTILFHDYQFNDKTNPEMKRWYIETIEFLIENDYEFISYKGAIEELESNNAKNSVCE